MIGSATAMKKGLDADGLAPAEQQAKVRREMDRLTRIGFTGWVVVHINGGELRLFECDEAAMIDTEHPTWPRATTGTGAVTIDGCVSTLASCQRDRFYGRLSIPMKGGVILAAPMRRATTLVRYLP